MLTHLLLLMAPAATPLAAQPVTGALAATLPQAARTQAGPQRAVGGGSRAATFAAQVGGNLWNSTGGGPQVVLLGRLEGNVYSLRITGTGTGWDEDFLLGIPPRPVSPAPLLVLFHQYSVSEYDTYSKTEFFKEALMRGWYVVAPLGAHEQNFAIDYSQRNIEVCLDWVTDFFGGALDSERVYGVGFSMGGGTMMAYAARHIDPEGVRFAALLNHTGGLSVADLYERCPNNTDFNHPLMFGGGPSTNEIGYQRASAVHMWPQPYMIDPDSDFVRNLQTTYIETWYSKLDPNPCPLVFQNNLFNRYLNTRPYLHQSFSSRVFEFYLPEHSWDLLDEGLILDTFSPLRARAPNGTTDVLADRDARYFYFDVEQSMPDVLSPFRFNCTQPGENRIFFDNYSNLAGLRVHSADAELDTSQILKLILEGNLGANPLTVKLTDYPNIPSNVLRNGQPSSAWSHSSTLGEVSLQVTNPGSADHYEEWKILP